MNINAPNVIVVTGPPGSGKTTLAHKLSREIGCPAICRDEIKVGYVVTQNKRHDELGDNVNAKVSEMFFDVVNTYLKCGITVIIEAAFQHNVWTPKLYAIKKLARLKLLICDVEPSVALGRRQRRLLSNPDRVRFHGENGEMLAGYSNALQDYVPPLLDVPTLQVNTTDEYDPKFETILRFITNDSRQ